MNDAKAEMLLEGVKVAVAVQQRVTFRDAECGDEAVDGPADCLAFGAEKAVILCCCYGECFASRVEYFKVH